MYSRCVHKALQLGRFVFYGMMWLSGTHQSKEPIKVLAPTAKQCKAKANRTGERCKNPAVDGLDVCRVHGGSSPRGIAHPNFVNGRTSKYTAGRIAAKIQDRLSNPDLRNHLNEIALVETFINDKLESLETIDTKSQLESLLKTIDDVLRALHSEDYSALDLSARRLRDLVVDRIKVLDTYEDIRKDLDARRKLIDSQLKIEASLEQNLTATQAMTIMQSLLNAVKENVTDRTALQNIQSAFILAVGSAHSERVDQRTGND